MGARQRRQARAELHLEIARVDGALARLPMQCLNEREEIADPMPQFSDEEIPPLLVACGADRGAQDVGDALQEPDVGRRDATAAQAIGGEHAERPSISAADRDAGAARSPMLDRAPRKCEPRLLGYVRNHDRCPRAQREARQGIIVRRRGRRIERTVAPAEARALDQDVPILRQLEDFAEVGRDQFGDQPDRLFKDLLQFRPGERPFSETDDSFILPRAQGEFRLNLLVRGYVLANAGHDDRLARGIAKDAPARLQCSESRRKGQAAGGIQRGRSRFPPGPRESPP